MASYKRERDLAVATLMKLAKSTGRCDGCMHFEHFMGCEELMDEDARCDICRGCACGECHGQSRWEWGGTPAPDMAPVVRCKDCAADGMITCPLTRIERGEMVFINHDPNWFCGDGVRRETE